MTRSLAAIGLGANLGDASATLTTALAELAQLPDSALEATSPFYRSAPIDADGPDYLNAVALLAELQRVEARHGRERGYRNAPRTLDLDLLVYDELRLATPALTLPHPR